MEEGAENKIFSLMLTRQLDVTANILRRPQTGIKPRLQTGAKPYPYIKVTLTERCQLRGEHCWCTTFFFRTVNKQGELISYRCLPRGDCSGRQRRNPGEAGESLRGGRGQLPAEIKRGVSGKGCSTRGPACLAPDGKHVWKCRNFSEARF